MQVLYLGRAPRTKETLPDFREKCRATRHSRVFHGLTGSQRTPGIWGVTEPISSINLFFGSVSVEFLGLFNFLGFFCSPQTVFIETRALPLPLHISNNIDALTNRAKLMDLGYSIIYQKSAWAISQ